MVLRRSISATKQQDNTDHALGSISTTDDGIAAATTPIAPSPSTASVVATAEAAKVISAADGTKAASRAGEGPSHRCLVVDDVSSNRKMIVNILEKQGHTVVTAEDGLAALAAYDEAVASNQLFSFVFMDFVMPSMQTRIITFITLPTNTLFLTPIKFCFLARHVFRHGWSYGRLRPSEARV